MPPLEREQADSDPPDWLWNRQRTIRFGESEVAQFAREVRRRVARGREFAVCIASEEALRRANRRFRGMPRGTDVLSFPNGGSGRLGDILISARRARAQAERQGHRVEEELKILLLHGVLHLLGHDHERDGGAMRRLERAWGRRLGLPAGLIERTGA